jgi:hypothetical protein
MEKKRRARTLGELIGKEVGPMVKKGFTLGDFMESWAESERQRLQSAIKAAKEEARKASEKARRDEVVNSVMRHSPLIIRRRGKETMVLRKRAIGQHPVPTGLKRGKGGIVQMTGKSRELVYKTGWFSHWTPRTEREMRERGMEVEIKKGEKK